MSTLSPHSVDASSDGLVGGGTRGVESRSPELNASHADAAGAVDDLLVQVADDEARSFKQSNYSARPEARKRVGRCRGWVAERVRARQVVRADDEDDVARPRSRSRPNRRYRRARASLRRARQTRPASSAVRPLLFCGGAGGESGGSTRLSIARLEARLIEMPARRVVMRHRHL